MLIKTLLNKVERFKSFIYGSIQVELVDGVEAVVIDIKPRRDGNSGNSWEFRGQYTQYSP
jgi:hypothetical protein